MMRRVRAASPPTWQVAWCKDSINLLLILCFAFWNLVQTLTTRTIICLHISDPSGTFLKILLAVTPCWRLNLNQGQKSGWIVTEKSISFVQTSFSYGKPAIGGKTNQTLLGLLWLKKEGWGLISCKWPLSRKFLKSSLNIRKRRSGGKGISFFFLSNWDISP